MKKDSYLWVSREDWDKINNGYGTSEMLQASYGVTVEINEGGMVTIGNMSRYKRDQVAVLLLRLLCQRYSGFLPSILI